MQRPAYTIYNGLAPKQGPLAVPVDLDFETGTDEHLIDLFQETTLGTLDYVQSVWVDNNDNEFPLQIDVNISNQRLIVPAQFQGVFPILCSPGSALVVSTTPPTEGVLRVRMLLLNVPMPIAAWGQ